MKTKQLLPEAIRGICKHDLNGYAQALQTVQAYGDSKITDAYGKRCKRVVDTIDIIYDGSDDTVKQLLDLVYLRRDKVSVEAAADILHMGKTTAYIILNGILIDYAVAMGYAKPKEPKKKGGKVA